MRGETVADARALE